MAYNSYSALLQGTNGNYLDVYVSATANASNMTSSVSWSVVYRLTASGSYYQYNSGNQLVVKINNTVIIDTSNICAIQLSGAGASKEIASGSFNISHNSDGTCSFPVYVYFNQTQRSDNYGTVSETFTCDTISVAKYNTLTIDPNGGTYNGSSSTQTFTKEEGSTNGTCAPRRPNYSFMGWKRTGGGSVNFQKFSTPTFESGMNSVNVYDNNNSGKISLTRMATTSDIGDPLSSGYVVKCLITDTGTEPGFGGFYHSVQSEQNYRYIHVFTAKLPVGYRFNSSSNTIGSNSIFAWLTSTEGTGEWEVYAYMRQAGESGTFSTFGHVYVEKIDTSGLTAFPLEWYLASSQIFDITAPDSNSDPAFRTRLSLNLYDNNNSGAVRIERIEVPSDFIDTYPVRQTATIAATHTVKITSTGTGSSPYLGGFYDAKAVSIGHSYIHIFIAKVPKGYELDFRTNDIGYNNRRLYWLSDNHGTGDWYVYSYMIECGTTGSFNNMGFVALKNLTGVSPSSENPVIWYIAFSDVINIYNVFTHSSSGTLTAMWVKNKYTLTLDATGGRINSKEIYTYDIRNFVGTAIPEASKDGYCVNYWSGRLTDMLLESWWKSQPNYDGKFDLRSGFCLDQSTICQYVKRIYLRYNGNGTFDVLAYAENVSSMKLPVWREPQDKTIIWYDMPSGSWTRDGNVFNFGKTFSIADFEYRLTGYYAHLYTYDSSENQLEEAGFQSPFDVPLQSGELYDGYYRSNTLYAHWKANQYKLTLSFNGGNFGGITSDLEMEEPLVFDDSSLCDIGNILPSRFGYEFMGWYSSSDGGIQIYDKNGLCTNDGTYWLDNKYVYPNDLVVYAQWKPINIVRYKMNSEYILCYTYVKSDGVWKPAIMKKKIDGEYKK